MSFDHGSDGIDGLDVLVVTNYAGAKNGGASRQAQALANALAADGYAADACAVVQHDGAVRKTPCSA